MRFGNRRRVSSTPTKGNSPSDLEPCGCCRDVPRGTPPDVVAAASDCAKRLVAAASDCAKRGRRIRSAAWATVSTCRARGPQSGIGFQAPGCVLRLLSRTHVDTSYPRCPVAVLGVPQQDASEVTQAGGRVPQRRAREVRRMIYARSAGRTSITSSWHRAARDLDRLSDGRVHWRATFTATPSNAQDGSTWNVGAIATGSRRPHVVSAHDRRSGRPRSATFGSFCETRLSCEPGRLWADHVAPGSP